MDDIHFKIGALETQVTQLNETVSQMETDVKEIKTQLLTWKSTAVGALTVLSVIGSIVLYFADAFVQYLKVKLGF